MNEEPELAQFIIFSNNENGIEFPKTHQEFVDFAHFLLVIKFWQFFVIFFVSHTLKILNKLNDSVVS